MEKKFKRSSFSRLAEKVSLWLGSSFTFFIALLFILGWAVSGFYYDFNQTWQLIINTGTTIATFLMVILIQNMQTRESRSIQLKLDELLYGTKNTRNSLLDIEDQSDEEIEEFTQEFKKLREKYLTRHKEKRK